MYNNDKLSSEVRTVYIPLNHSDGSNPDVPVEEPFPGVFIFRVRQSPLYPSVGHYTVCECPLNNLLYCLVVSSLGPTRWDHLASDEEDESGELP